MRLAHVSRRLVASTVALVLGASSLAASAKPWHEPGGEGDRYGHSQRGPGHDGRDDRRGDWEGDQPHHGPSQRWEGREYSGHQEPRVSVQVHTQVRTDDMRMGPGAGPEHRYHRGDWLPPEARQSVMVVQDWRDHRLDPPPRGHDWVRLGSDFVLVAAATGIIAQVILSAGR